MTIELKTIYKLQQQSKTTETLEEWAQEVGRWANLAQYKADFKQTTQDTPNLWLPLVDERELGLLLALTNLAEELGCSVGMLVELLANSGSDTPTIAPAIPVISNPVMGEAATPNHAELLEALSEWQVALELAIDQAGSQLPPKDFPAEDLNINVALMCQLVRLALNSNRKPS